MPVDRIVTRGSAGRIRTPPNLPRVGRSDTYPLRVLAVIQCTASPFSTARSGHCHGVAGVLHIMVSSGGHITPPPMNRHHGPPSMTIHELHQLRPLLNLRTLAEEAGLSYVALGAKLYRYGSQGRGSELTSPEGMALDAAIARHFRRAGYTLYGPNAFDASTGDGPVYVRAASRPRDERSMGEESH